MQKEKPTEPFALSLITGIIIVIDGIIPLFVSLNPTSFPTFAWHLVGVNTIFFILETIAGILVIFGAIMLYLQPRRHVVWSIVILVFTILSIPLRGGISMGLSMGGLLGIIGGVWGIVWKPSEVSLIPFAVVLPPSPKTLVAYIQKCPQCGSVLLQDVKNCPNCGKALK